MLFLFNIISKTRSFVLFNCQIKKNLSKCLAHECNFFGMHKEHGIGRSTTQFRCKRISSSNNWCRAAEEPIYFQHFLIEMFRRFIGVIPDSHDCWNFGEIYYWDFPVTTERSRLLSCLLYGLLYELRVCPWENQAGGDTAQITDFAQTWCKCWVWWLNYSGKNLG